MPLNVNDIRTPAAADADAAQAKYTLSAAARNRLRRASDISGQTMSNILEMLIIRELVLPDDPQPAPARNASNTEENFIG